MIAVVTCPNCSESSDVDVIRSMGATDLIPTECPVCLEPWPPNILYDERTEVYV